MLIYYQHDFSCIPHVYDFMCLISSLVYQISSIINLQPSDRLFLLLFEQKSLFSNAKTIIRRTHALFLEYMTFVYNQMHIFCQITFFPYVINYILSSIAFYYRKNSSLFMLSSFDNFIFQRFSIRFSKIHYKNAQKLPVRIRLDISP